MDTEEKKKFTEKNTELKLQVGYTMKTMAFFAKNKEDIGQDWKINTVVYRYIYIFMLP